MIRRSLTASMVDGAFYAIMVGLCENYFSALAVELGFSNAALALFSSVPLLVGALAQIFTPYWVGLLGSRKRLVLVAACLQATANLFFWWIALQGSASLATFLMAKILYWTSGMALMPAWSAWLGSLTTDLNRERFFAWRSALGQASLLIAYAAGGLILEHGRQAHTLFVAFSTSYMLGTVARLLSITAMTFQTDPGDIPAPEKLSQTFPRLKQVIATAHWRVPIFIALLQFGAYLSIPFYAPYMLRTCKMNYLAYAIITCISILTKALFLPSCYRLGAWMGLRALLFWSGCGVAITPLFWVGATSVRDLIWVQIFSGVAWGALEFASFQLLFSSCPGHWRLPFFSLANSLSSFAQVSGAVCGAQLLKMLPYGYEVTFFASAVMRSLPLLLILPTVGWMSLKQPVIPRFFWRLLSINSERNTALHPNNEVK